ARWCPPCSRPTTPGTWRRRTACAPFASPPRACAPRILTFPPSSGGGCSKRAPTRRDDFSPSGTSGATCGFTVRARAVVRETGCERTMLRDRYIYVNGEWVDAAGAKVSVEDRGYQFADGIYEVVRVYRGRPFALEAHLQRLARSAAQLELDLPLEASAIGGLIREAPERRGVREAQVYVQVTRGFAP